MIKAVTLDNLTDIVPLFDAYRVFYKKAAEINQAQAYLHERLSAGDAVAFAYYEANQAIAFTLCYFTFSSTTMTKTLQLNDLFVEAAYRSKGIGAALIDHVFAYAKTNDFASVGIETAHDNLGAQKLYARLGFVQGTTVHYQKTMTQS